MDILSISIQGKDKTGFAPVMLSISLHLLLFAFLWSLPMFRSSSQEMPPVLDVTLLDFSGEDIVSGMEVAPEVAPESAPPKTKDLVDPSDAELKRMKKRNSYKG